MSKFLKLKSIGTDQRVLFAAEEIALVSEAGEGCVITLKGTGEEIGVKEGYQTVVNRLTKDSE